MGTRRIPVYEVRISYTDTRSLDDEVHDAAGKISEGSGTNLRTGERDLSFDAKGKAAALAMAKKIIAALRKAKAKKWNVSVVGEVLFVSNKAKR